MDDIPQPSQPNIITAKPPFPKKPLIIFTIILSLFVTLLILNSLNLLPAFSFLSGQTPPQNQSLPVSKPSPSPTPLNISLSCPVPKEFCSKAQTVPSSNFFLGLSFKLPAGTAVLAPFDGIYDTYTLTDKDGSSTTIKVKSAGEEYSAVYFFAGDDKNLSGREQAETGKPYPVKVGEKMATVSAKPAPYRFQKGQSLIFYVYKGSTDSASTRITLKPEDLLKEVDLGTR